jgi:D-lactate dehydrogenase
MKALIYSTKEFEKSYLLDANQQKHDLTVTSKPLNLDTASMAKGYDAVVLFTNDDASGDVLRKLHQVGVQYVATRSVGIDHIDLKVASELGIRIANVPHYSPNSVAEHTVALMLALNRKLIIANAKSHAYQFELSSLIGFDMYQKTVGIIGLGTIGGVVADILKGFGCKLLVYDNYVKNYRTSTEQMKFVELDELLTASDIITLHAPLTDETKHLISKPQLELMKKNVMLINTSRGGLLNTVDVLEALRDRKIGYLGLDVYENERGIFFKNHFPTEGKDKLLTDLMNFNNVLVTGHQAFLTNEALTNIADKTIQNLNEWEMATPEECNAKIGRILDLDALIHNELL